MRLAFFVDSHNRFQIVSEKMLEIGDVDALLIGGDITSSGSVVEAAGAIQAWKMQAPRLYALAGNWDSPAIDEYLSEQGVGLNGRGVVLAEGVGVCGVSGSPASAINAPYELEEEEILRRLERGLAEIEDCRLWIVCSHTPPIYTSCDRMYGGVHIGSRAVRLFVERHQPALVLCGHVHEARGRDEIGQTRIVNPGPAREGHYALVEIEGGAVSVTLA